MESVTILKFWFEEIESKMHWVKDPEFDQLLRDRFLEAHGASMRGELEHWRETPEGCLAEVILLDQFSRNMFRDTPQAFASDELALSIAKSAIERGFHKQIDKDRRSFLYMPYMHSESAAVHEEALAIFGDPEWGAGSMDFELKHKAIIDRFGRYPHRNEILGRESTPEEIEFLKGPGSSF